VALHKAVCAGDDELGAEIRQGRRQTGELARYLSDGQTADDIHRLAKAEDHIV